MSTRRFRKVKHRNTQKPLHPEDHTDWPARNSLLAFINQSMQELQYRAFDAKKTWGQGVLVATYDARDDSVQTHWLGYGTAKDLARDYGAELYGALMAMGEFAEQHGYTVMIAEYINPFGGSQRCTTCVIPTPRPGGTTEHMPKTPFSWN